MYLWRIKFQGKLGSEPDHLGIAACSKRDSSCRLLQSLPPGEQRSVAVALLLVLLSPRSPAAGPRAPSIQQPPWDSSLRFGFHANCLLFASERTLWCGVGFSVLFLFALFARSALPNQTGGICLCCLSFHLFSSPTLDSLRPFPAPRGLCSQALCSPICVQGVRPHFRHWPVSFMN